MKKSKSQKAAISKLATKIKKSALLLKDMRNKMKMLKVEAKAHKATMMVNSKKVAKKPAAKRSMKATAKKMPARRTMAAKSSRKKAAR